MLGAGDGYRDGLVSSLGILQPSRDSFDRKRNFSIVFLLLE